MVASMRLKTPRHSSDQGENDNNRKLSQEGSEGKELTFDKQSPGQ